MSRCPRWTATATRPRGRMARLFGVALVAAVVSSVLVPLVARADPGHTITSLGRIEPKDGVMQIAGPSTPGAVIGRLLINEGNRVEEGERIAIMDTYALNKAEAKRLEAELTNAARELERVRKLHRERDVEGCTAVGPVFSPHPTAVGDDDSARNRET